MNPLKLSWNDFHHDPASFNLWYQKSSKESKEISKLESKMLQTFLMDTTLTLSFQKKKTGEN